MLKGDAKMFVYIGIEDLVANAIIELAERNIRNEVYFDELTHYGTTVVQLLLAEDKKAVLLLSQDSTLEFIRDYSDYFELFKNNDTKKEGIKLKENISIDTLWDVFRGYLSVDLMKAFSNQESLSKLGVPVV